MNWYLRDNSHKEMYEQKGALVSPGGAGRLGLSGA